MITVRTQKSVKNAKRYFREHLVQGDYYTEGHKIQGHWIGLGAERLGLEVNGPVRSREYDRLCDNLHPLTGQRLTLRTRKERRIYDDFAMAPPKSVSIMAVTMGDERIVAAHDRAVAVAIAELEKVAATRVRKGGKDQNRRTGEIVGAVFRHDASRALDPLLHTHLLVFNATWDPVERRWKALEAGDMFEQTRFLTAVYRNHLAGELTGMGYRLREARHGYEIAGVPEAVIERLSKRSVAIAREESRLAEELGTPLTNNGRAAVARATRQRKVKDLPTAELVRRQREQLTPEELALLEGLRSGKFVPLVPVAEASAAVEQVRAPTRTERASETGEQSKSEPPNQAGSGSGTAASQTPQDSHATLAVASAKNPRAESASSQPAPQIEPQAGNRSASQRAFAHAHASITPQQAVTYARDHVFERASVVPEADFLTVALDYSRGRLTLDEIRGGISPQNDLIRVGEMLTTGQTLQAEQRMIALVNEGIGQCRPLNPRFHPTTTLSDEQRHVVDAVLQSTDAVMGIRGSAGAGKTFVLKQLVAGMEARGHAVLVFAPTAAAVEVLREEGFSQSHTVQHLLSNPGLQAELQGKVLVVDEAGLVSTRQMVRLLELRRAADARLLLCGDTREHTGIEAGDALRLLEARSALPVAELGQIRRQTEAEYRQAIAEIAAGHPAAAFQRLDRLGAVEEVGTGERYLRLATDYVKALEAGQTALIVAPTWGEIETVNGEIRERLKATGHLDASERVVETHRTLQWTEAQRRDFRNYQPGDVLTFHRATRDFAAGEWGKLMNSTPDQLTVQKQNGQEVSLTRKQVRCYDVARVHALPVGRHEQLLIQGNRQKDSLLNGQVVTVDSVQPDGSIVLKNGRTIPHDFRRFTHGYCVTSQSSQGKTVDCVFVAVDSRSGQAVNQKQFYVSASRGRRAIKIYTDDKTKLQAALGRPGTREGAIELMDRAEHRLRQAASDTLLKRARRAMRL